MLGVTPTTAAATVVVAKWHLAVEGHCPLCLTWHTGLEQHSFAYLTIEQGVDWT